LKGREPDSQQAYDAKLERLASVTNGQTPDAVGLQEIDDLPDARTRQTRRAGREASDGP
jgi:hypothetical protein